MKKHFLLLMMICIPALIFPQVVYQDLTNTNIYDFIDELANMKIINLSSAVKPYSREFIALSLNSASSNQELLNKRQKKELAFYLREYHLELSADASWFKRSKGLFKNKKNFGIPGNPLAFIFKDSLFTFSLRPIWGIRFYYNGNSDKLGNIYHRWGGAEMFGSIGKHLGFYASLRDNHESQLLVSTSFFSKEEGANWKTITNNSGDYSEMRGGVTYKWNWGSVALAKDHFQWGDNYNGSNIISGRAPSFPYLSLSMKPVKWFGFDYFHGWLISQVVDSSRTWKLPDGALRNYYFNKYFAAALFTFVPVKYLSVSVGNSVIYSAGYPNPAFLSPFLFFIDFSYQGNDLQKKYYGQNSQLFMNISSRNIRHLHLYGSFFIDSFTWSKLGGKNGGNPESYKAGFRLSDLPFHNLSLTAEYTLTNPGTYNSVIPTLTYASNLYPLGNFMADHSQDIYAALNYIPLRGLRMNIMVEQAEHKENQGEQPPYKNFTIGGSIKYEVINNAYLFFEYFYSQIQGNVVYIPVPFIGINNTISFGFNIGF